MLRFIVVLASCLVMHPLNDADRDCVYPCSSVAGQPAAAADPISGLWGSRDSAGLDLKFDGKSAVTGTIYITGHGAAPISSGSFDPSTRALKVAGLAPGPDGKPAPWSSTSIATALSARLTRNPPRLWSVLRGQ